MKEKILLTRTIHDFALKELRKNKTLSKIEFKKTKNKLLNE